MTNENLIDKINAEQYLDKFKKELIEVDIHKITPNEWNPNRHNEQSFQTLINSIKQFGFNDPISVRQIIKGIEEYEIIDGWHRWKAAKELGFTKVTVINFGEVTREEAIVLTQLLNHKGKDDILLRAKLFQELQNQRSLFDLLPGEEKEKLEEIKLLSFDFNQFKQKAEELKEKDENEGELLGQAYRKALELRIIVEKILDYERYKARIKDDKLCITLDEYLRFCDILESFLSTK